MLKRVSSRDNAGWREAVALAHQARERKRQRRVVLEGIHLCQAWRDAHPAGFDTLIVSDGALAHPEVLALARTPAPRAWQVPDALFRELSQLDHGIGIAAIVPWPVPDWPSAFTRDVVFLDRLQDPGNVGTILRTCAAVGVHDVMLAPDSVAAWSPKVLRAGMGAHFALRLHEGVPWSRLRDATPFVATVTALDGASPLFGTDLRAPRLWVFGHEGGGVDPTIADDPAAQRITIPQQPGIESLNVSSAVAVCLYEQWRQRAAPGGAARSAGSSG